MMGFRKDLIPKDYVFPPLPSKRKEYIYKNGIDMEEIRNWSWEDATKQFDEKSC